MLCVLRCGQDGQDGPGCRALDPHNTLARSQLCRGGPEPGCFAEGGSKALRPPLRARAADSLQRAAAARFPPQVLRSLKKTYQSMKRKPVTVDLDPKAVTCNELFGVIHPSTREWKDGEAPTLAPSRLPGRELSQTVLQQRLARGQMPP